MRENYICDLVTCRNWDSIENANEETSTDRWNKKCKECYHSKNNPKGNVCNFKIKEE